MARENDLEQVRAPVIAFGARLICSGLLTWNPFVTKLDIFAFDGRPRDAVGEPFACLTRFVFGEGMVEGAAIDFLRMERQVASDGRRKIFHRGIRHAGLPFRFAFKFRRQTASCDAILMEPRRAEPIDPEQTLQIPQRL